MLRTLTAIKSLLLLLFISVSISQTVSLQGVLREPSGNTVQDGYFSLTFNLYDQDEGGSALWTETHGSVPVKHGVYAVELGSLTSFNDLTFSVQYYVGISVESGAELTPRVKLTNSPTTMAVFGVENVFPSSGNVGVGTTDPQALLHIDQSGSEDVIRLDKDSDTKMIVDSDGNVGIGTSNPEAMLHVEGSGSMLKLDNGTSILQFTPDGVMHVPNSINFPDGSVLTTAQGSSASALSSPGNADIVADNDIDGTGDIQFVTGINNRMVIKNSGNVGISTLSPIMKLDVDLNVAGESNVARFQNTIGNTAVHINSPSESWASLRFQEAGDNKWYLGRDADNSLSIYDYTDEIYKMSFFPGGDIKMNSNLGIGILPAYALHVNDNVEDVAMVENTSGSGYLNIKASSGYAGIKFLEGSATAQWFIGQNTTNDFYIYDYSVNNYGVKMKFWDNDAISLYGDDIYLNANTSVTGTLGVTGNTSVTGTLGVSALTTLSTTHIHGDVTVYPGNTTTSQLKIYMNLGSGEQTIHPATPNYGYIGYSGAHWYKMYYTVMYYDSQYSISDRTTKQNIQSLVDSRSTSTNLDKVLALNPVKYDINMDTHPFYKDVELKEGQLEDSKDNLGFIAQELMEIIPEMVKYDKDYELYTIRNYEQMFPVLVGAMQEMKAENDDLKSRIERLEALLIKE